MSVYDFLSHSYGIILKVKTYNTTKKESFIGLSLSRNLHSIFNMPVGVIITKSRSVPVGLVQHLLN